MFRQGSSSGGSPDGRTVVFEDTSRSGVGAGSIFAQPHGRNAAPVDFATDLAASANAGVGGLDELNPCQSTKAKKKKKRRREDQDGISHKGQVSKLGLGMAPSPFTGVRGSSVFGCQVRGSPFAACPEAECGEGAGDAQEFSDGSNCRELGLRSRIATIDATDTHEVPGFESTAPRRGLADDDDTDNDDCTDDELRRHLCLAFGEQIDPMTGADGV
eukprot:gnl/TRDRNA2_/TRDRNA2_139739_c0_seq1.p1 gnl/TRDRNA2_/TRDRNA2_139739_c0~~gnl/TRDRNA2_/TRDRNA2_139739_c0_seq1.p1  ORF type:complete len:224 (-),score=28.41 gnl/TRDRNA2_/TRDRNA2_139739_c0_seq1:29-676(-)